MEATAGVGGTGVRVCGWGCGSVEQGTSIAGGRVSSGIPWEEGRLAARGPGTRVRHEIQMLGGRGSPTDGRAGNPRGAGPAPRRGIRGGMDPGEEPDPTLRRGRIGDPLPALAAGQGRHPSHRWNRFLNRIDPPLLLGGRELRLVSAGGRARGPHGLGLLGRLPACPADRSAGQAGVGQARGRDRTGARPGGWGREGGRLNGPRASRLPPPGSSAPGHPRPAPEPGSTPARSAGLRAPAAASASPSRTANQHTERRGGNAAFHPAAPGRRGGASRRRGGASRWRV